LTHQEKGTPLDKADIRAAFQAHHTPEAVIVTLNAPRTSESPFAALISPPRLMADCNANVVAIMKEFNVSKIVIMQAFGVGDSWPNLHCVLRLLMKKSNMIYQYDDHNLVDKEVRASGLDYVLARPSRLKEGATQRVKVWPDAGRGVPMMAGITRTSVAHWLVDAAEGKAWDNTAPVITN
jgi:putative NAD(P)-binding protein